LKKKINFGSKKEPYYKLKSINNHKQYSDDYYLHRSSQKSVNDDEDIIYGKITGFKEEKSANWIGVSSPTCYLFANIIS